MDDAAQSARETSRAWIDDAQRIVSFHEIPCSRLLDARSAEFWQIVVGLIARGYRVQ